jgi:hypothetical protein
LPLDLFEQPARGQKSEVKYSMRSSIVNPRSSTLLLLGALLAIPAIARFIDMSLLDELQREGFFDWMSR